MGFRPIMAGAFGPIAVNGRLREIWAEIDSFKQELAAIKELAGGTSPMPEPDDEEPETVTVDSAETVFCASVFDDLDGPAICRWAKEKHGLEIDDEQERDAILKEIEAFLTEDDAFDWRTSDDLQAIKSHALLEFGLTISGTVKKVETAREQIEAFLADNGN